MFQVSYSIGVAAPLSLFVDSYGTCAEGYTDDCLLRIVAENFDFRPGVIQRDLRLKVNSLAELQTFYEIFDRVQLITLRRENSKCEYLFLSLFLFKKVPSFLASILKAGVFFVLLETMLLCCYLSFILLCKLLSTRALSFSFCSLSLQEPLFKELAAYGHFGRCPEKYAWEKPRDLSHCKKSA